MKTPFRLNEHPRRSQPLAPPPDHYFEQLPRRIMQRVRPETTSVGVGWLAALTGPWRTALAASVVLGGFAGSFLLSESASTIPALKQASLAAVPHSELVAYLLAGEQSVALTDLAELPASALPEIQLQASPDELQQALDAQPTEETYL